MYIIYSSALELQEVTDGIFINYKVCRKVEHITALRSNILYIRRIEGTGIKGRTLLMPIYTERPNDLRRKKYNFKESICE